MKEKIELNEDFQRALDLLENSNQHLFITGRAGTGKSTLLKYWRDITKKEVVVLAPTGVSALNIGGETVHSFFGFQPDVTVKSVRRKGKDNRRGKIIKRVETIVIDEASMVRADLLDCIDEFLRINSRDGRHLPFGGKQLVFVGDLYQLPPIVPADQEMIFNTHYATPYFFSAHVFDNAQGQLVGLGDAPVLERIELKKIYRQVDQDFIEALNEVRSGQVSRKSFTLLNDRVDSTFEPNPRKKQFWIHLTTTNAEADLINDRHLKQLRGKSTVSEATISGKISGKSFPTQAELNFKKGAQVMFVSNDQEGRYVNGTVGRVAGFEGEQTDPTAIYVELESGELVEVFRRSWEAIKWEYDEKTKSLDTEVIGSFVQFPLRLAWAVTVHKSQGKTFDRVVLDLGARTFASGQAYVALSRCRTLAGLILKRPIGLAHLKTDRRVTAFMTGQEIKARPVVSNQELKHLADMIIGAIEEGCALRIGYIGADGQSTERLVAPQKLGDIIFNGKTFFGMQAFCFLRKEIRAFRLDRIATVETIEAEEFITNQQFTK